MEVICRVAEPMFGIFPHSFQAHGSEITDRLCISHSHRLYGPVVDRVSADYKPRDFFLFQCLN